MQRTLCCLHIAAALLLSHPARAQTGPDLTQAQTLLREGKAAAAYELLQPLEFAQAGDPEFDYLLGVAALDSGQYGAATLAFERVLAVNPNHAGARVDLARAYFGLNNLDRAEEQFKLVLTLDPPPLARQTAEAHLARIAETRKARKPSWAGYVEGVVGYDTNLTNVTRDFTNAVFQSFGLPGIAPTGNSIPREDGYAGVNVGASYNHPQGQGITWHFGLDGRQREYFRDHRFRSTTLAGQFGVSYKQDQDTYRLGLSVQHFLQDGEAATVPRTTLDSDIYGLSGSWQHALDNRTQLALFGQINFVRYADIPTSEINAATLGAAVTHSFAARYQPAILASLYHTHETALNPLANGTDLSRDVLGFRLAGQLTFDEQWVGFASFGYQLRDDTSLGARQIDLYGRDTLADLSVGLVWKWDKNWSLRPQVAYTRTHSNIPLYETTRTDYSVTLRREFQ